MSLDRDLSSLLILNLRIRQLLDTASMPAQTVSVTLLQVGRSPREFKDAMEEKFPQSIVWRKDNGKDGARLIAPRMFLGDIVDELDDGRKLCDMTVGEMFPRHILVEGSLLDAVAEVLSGLQSRVIRKFVIRDSFDMVIAT